MSRPKIGIALSGGSALGYAHIGVIKALQESDIDIDYVAGTSMGAIVGAAFASGIDMDCMKKIVYKWRIFKFTDLTFKPRGVFAGRHITKILKQVIPNINVEDTKIPFRCVAVDLKKGQQYIWKEGSLLTAVRSSMSVPGLFVPVKKDDMLLVDGGVMDNLPDEVVRDMGADVVLSFDAIGGYRIKRVPRSAAKTLLAATFIMQSRMLEADHSDILVSMEQNNDEKYIFGKRAVEKMVKDGYTKTMEAMPEIKKIIAKKAKELEAKEKGNKVMKPLVKKNKK